MLDLLNPPKYCPQCEGVGQKNKVKKFRMKDGCFVLMCKSDKCPWPFSEYSKEEVTFKDEDVCLKKRKGDLKDSPEKIKSPNHKKPRISDDNHNFRNAINPLAVDLHEKPLEESEQVPVDKVSEVLEDIVGDDPEEPVENPLNFDELLPQTILEKCDESSCQTEPEPGSTQAKSAPGAEGQHKRDLDDRDFFKAIPVAVRQPIRLPKHAAHILNSRLEKQTPEPTPAQDSGMDESGIDEEDEDEEMDEFEGSDSELESLVSECSSMSTISESSTDDGKGAGKIKKRGKKKKRKDRRKQHNSTCSKEMDRGSDIAAVFVPSLTSKRKQKESQNVLEKLKTVENPENIAMDAFTVDPEEIFPDSDQEDPLREDSSIRDQFIVVNEAVLDGVHTPDKPSPECEIMYKDKEIEINFIPAQGGPDTKTRTGALSRCAQFSFSDPVTGSLSVFPPVFVHEVDLEHLINIVTEQAEKFKIKAHKIQGNLGLESRFVVSRSKLERSVIKHVEKCFTKKAMKEYKVKMEGEKKRKRSPRKRKGKDTLNTSNISESDEMSISEIESEETEIEMDTDCQSSSVQSSLENATEPIVENTPEDDISLFKKPLGPARSYHSPRTLPSPRRGFTEHGVPSPKYCMILSEPMSPMPATPRGPDHEEEQEEDTNHSIIPEMDSVEDISHASIAADGAECFESVLGKNKPIHKRPAKKKRQAMKQDQKTESEIPVLMESLSNRLMLNTGIDIKASVMPTPQEMSVTIPTLVLMHFEDEDPDFAHVRKVGSGSSSLYSEPPPTVEAPASMSNCVFHVAQNMSIDLPKASDNLEIENRGSNKIFLTADSDQIEAHTMRAETIYHKPGKKKLRKKVVVEEPIPSTFGPGWFIWKDWRVDSELFTNFTHYMEDLMKKWNKTEPLQALFQEKDVSPEEQLKDIVDFFFQVYMKVNHVTSMYRLPVPDCLDFIRTKYNTPDTEFNALCEELFDRNSKKPVIPDLIQILSKETIEKLDKPDQPPPGYIKTLPPVVAAKIISSIGGKSPVIDVKKPPVKFELPLSPVFENHGTSVAVLESVQPLSQTTRVGQGEKCLQFFFENPMDGFKIAFNPVYVKDDEDVKYVVALVSEKAGDYRYRSGYTKKPTQYFSDAVKARSKLEPEVIRYIESCFTKRGMKDNKAGMVKKNYPKKRIRVLVDKSKVKIKQELLEENDSPEELDISENEFDEDLESKKKPDNLYLSDEDDSKRVLEERVFGGRMPKVKVRERHFVSKAKIAREGQHDDDDDDDENIAPNETVISMVDHVLDTKSSDPDTGKRIASKLKLSSLLKSRKQRRRPSTSESSSNDEDDVFQASGRYSYLRASVHDDSLRTSDRLRKKYGMMDAEGNPAPDKVQSKVHSNGDSEKPLTNGKVSSLKGENKTIESPPRRVKFQNVPGEEMNEVVRSLSQCSRPGSAMDRPPSQSDSRPGSRPGSRSDRPGSRLLNKSRIHFGSKIDCIDEPDRDSPVLTPRLRHQERLNRSPGAKSPLIPKTVPEVPKTPPLLPAPSSQPLPSVPAVSLDSFKQINIRKSKQKKVHKILEKQKRKAEKNTKKKLLGFGQKKDEVEKQNPKTETKPHLKKAQVTDEERDLIAQLLQVGEMAVKETSSKLDSEPVAKTTVAPILDFEEAHGMDTGVLEEIDELFSAF